MARSYSISGEIELVIYRASELGSCTKFLAAKRQGYDEMENPDHVELWFKEGNLHEDAVISTLMEDGYWVDDRQLQVDLLIDNELVVQGHIDGSVIAPMTETKRLLEIKSMSKDEFERFEKDGWETSGLIQKYKWQLSAYMLATGWEALVVVKNRNNGQLRFVGVELPFYTMAEITGRIMEVEGWVERDQLPTLCDWVQYPCPFYYLHQEESTDNPNVDMAAVRLAAGRYLAAKKNEEAAKEITKLNRDYLIEVMGGVDKVKEEGLSVTYYDYTTTTLDKGRMKDDGIDLKHYERETKSKRLRVKLDGEPDNDTER